MRKSLLYDGAGIREKLQEKDICLVWERQMHDNTQEKNMSLYTRIIDLQKLDAGLQKVLKNKPAPGADGITYDMFEANKKEYLKQLHLELQEHRYHPLPVKLVQLYKGEKERTVALYAMRDKVIQQSIAFELQKIYEPAFSGGTYAYRNGRSALQAIDHMEAQIRRRRDGWVLKADIHSFFNTISAEKLRKELQHTLKETDVVDLILENAQAESLMEDGEIVKKERGIWQGSGIAPILSNIYLKDFDYQMAEKTPAFVRYSDDMLAVAKDQEAASELLRFVRVCMEERGLTLNEKKTMLIPVSSGVDFLGYHLDGNGKSVPVKAEQNLKERLESMFLTSSALTAEEKLKKGAEILEGWEQYYREERKIQSVLEYAVVLYMVRRKEPEILQKIAGLRASFHNTYRELAEYMISVWKEQERTDLWLLEYEQLYGLEELDQGCRPDPDSPFVQELLSGYERLIVYEEPDVLTEMIQDYTELHCLNKAARLMERYQRLQNTEKDRLLSPPAVWESDTGKEPELDGRAVRLFCELFVGREDTYAEEYMAQRRVVEQKNEPLTEEIVREHLSGRRTVGTYVQRPNSTAKYLVIDLDVSKKIFLKYSIESPEFSQYMKKCAHAAAEALKALDRLGLKGYAEYSGCRGYHIWIFFTEWIPVRYIHALSQIITEQIKEVQTEEISVEYFPDDRKLRAGKAGQNIKLPLGIHPGSGLRSYFLNGDLQAVTDFSAWMKDAAKFSLPALKRIIGMHGGQKKEEPAISGRREILDRNLEGFGKFSAEVQTVLERCNLMCYLCQKARKTGYLSHFERQSVLYVFGHMGEEGKEFVHQIMSYTLNYQYQVTERFLHKLPGKPVSCVKLREQYRQITAEIGCTCNFKRTKNCYPSPVLHALKSTDAEDGQITIPSSRSLSKEKEKTVYQEINVYRKVQELAEKILGMKRQKRGIDKNITKLERELEQVFDGMQADCLEIEMGLLCRRKKEDGSCEWVIEI